MHTHVALLGDSIFDNASYVGGEPDVAEHLRRLLPEWRVTLCAVDGSTTGDVGVQFDRVPRKATHLVMSLGGNDALLNADLLNYRVRSTAQALDLFSERLSAFEVAYGYAVDGALMLERTLTVCTIYNGNLPGREGPRAATALMMFNDVIVRTARSRGVPVIELRDVCTEPRDYANPIEPSGPGGEKIASAIAAALVRCPTWDR